MLHIHWKSSSEYLWDNGMGREGGVKSSVKWSRATNPSTSARWRPIVPQLNASIYPGIGRLRILCVQSLHLSYCSVFAITIKQVSVFPHSKLTTELSLSVPEASGTPLLVTSAKCRKRTLLQLYSVRCVIDTKCISEQVWSTGHCPMRQWYDLVKFNILGISLCQLKVRNVAWVVKWTGRKK